MKPHDGFAHRSVLYLMLSDSLENEWGRKENENDMCYAAYRNETKEWWLWYPTSTEYTHTHTTSFVTRTQPSLFAAQLRLPSTIIKRHVCLLLLLFGVTSYADMPAAYTGFRDLIHYHAAIIVNPCYGGTIHFRLEPITGMLLNRSKWRLYHGTARPCRWIKMPIKSFRSTPLLNLCY